MSNIKTSTLTKYQGVNEFHLLAHMGCYCTRMHFSRMRTAASVAVSGNVWGNVWKCYSKLKYHIYTNPSITNGNQWWPFQPLKATEMNCETQIPNKGATTVYLLDPFQTTISLLSPLKFHTKICIIPQTLNSLLSTTKWKDVGVHKGHQRHNDVYLIFKL